MLENTPEANDSIRMYKWGVEGGRTAPSIIGISPEWFYKGTGVIVSPCREPLVVRGFAEDPGEEVEFAGCTLWGDSENWVCQLEH